MRRKITSSNIINIFISSILFALFLVIIRANEIPVNAATEPSCQEVLRRDVTEVACYEKKEGLQAAQTLALTALVALLQNSNDLALKVGDIDMGARTTTGVSTADTPTGDAYRSDAQGKNKVRDNPGFLELFLTPKEDPEYKNKAALGKTSPIRFNFEIGLRNFTCPIPIPFITSKGRPMICGIGDNLVTSFFEIPSNGTGSVSAASFDPLLHGCSVVYTEPAGTSPVLPLKLSCTYVIDNPEVLLRYFGSIRFAQDNTDISLGPIGDQPKLDMWGRPSDEASIPEPQATITPPAATPPPSFTGSCNLCNYTTGNFANPGSALKALVDEVANAVGTPASVLTGMLKFEGYERNNPNRHIFYNTNQQILDMSAPNGTSPYCETSYAGAKGPCQFMPSQWNQYGNEVLKYVSDGRTPNICNVRDCLYAAATKLRQDAGRLGSACGYNNDTPPPAGSCDWTGANVAKSIYHYYGACSDNYVPTVVNYYYNYTCQ